MDQNLQEFSEESKIRIELAQSIIDSMPDDLSSEVAVVGSASWGIADEYSDLDIDLWIDTCQTVDEIKSWLMASYPSNLVLEVDPDKDGECIRAAIRINSIWVEMVWRTFHFQGQLILSIASGEVSSRGVLINARNIFYSLPIKSKGSLGKWKDALSKYPEILTARIVISTASFWRLPHRIEMLWTLAARGNLLSINEWIAADVEDALRILFAINHLWEPDWKNLSPALTILDIKPSHVEERVDDIFSAQDAVIKVRQSLRLVLDVLNLVPSEYDVELAKTNIRESLDTHPAD